MATDLRQFAPVEENVERPASLRQTLLSQFDKCPRSGYLALRYGGGAGTPAQARGTAFHLMAETATKEMIAQGETRIDPPLARDLIEQILQEETDLVVPLREHESLRQMAWNWAKGFVLEGTPIVEAQAYIELEGWRLTGTLDLLFIEHPEVRIKDYKTGFVIPKQEEYERQFQAPFYGLLAAEGRWVETDERIAVGVQGVHAHQVYPRHLNKDGKLEERYAYYDAGDLLAFRQSVVSVIRKIEHGLKTGEYPAQAGHHCGLCPAPHECPIPREFRRGEVRTLDEASAALALAEALTAEATRLKGDARTYAEDHHIEAVPLGEDSDLEYAFSVVEQEVINDKRGLKEALARNADPSSFFTTRTQTKFAKRRRNK